MKSGEPFIDYYAALEVKPDCHPRSLESAYRHLAKLFHPDHPETADVDRFNEVVSAYRALRDPGARAEYDAVHSAETGRSARLYFTDDEATPEEKAALEDAEIHELVLRLLYRRRREQASDPGIPPYYVQDLLGVSDDLLAFHIWYLKEKGLIQGTEAGTLAITIEGVDHVIAMSRNANAEKLRIAHTRDPES